MLLINKIGFRLVLSLKLLCFMLLTNIEMLIYVSKSHDDT